MVVVGIPEPGSDGAKICFNVFRDERNLSIAVVA